jgi:hypothetical protein
MGHAGQGCGAGKVEAGKGHHEGQIPKERSPWNCSSLSRTPGGQLPSLPSYVCLGPLCRPRRSARWGQGIESGLV